MIGSNPVRFYQFGQNDKQPSVYPYAVWQRVGGSPENYVGDVADIDSFTIQIDIYAESANSARNIAQAIRDSIEQPQAAYITNWLGESRDPDTQSYRFTMLTDWWTPR